jgi:hypothetical protein
MGCRLATTQKAFRGVMSLCVASLSCAAQTHNFLGDVVGFLYCPLMTAEAFAEASGLPLGVVEAQMDRRIIPVVRLGKRRLVSVEALRQRAL